jgi:hypothetical protein
MFPKSVREIGKTLGIVTFACFAAACSGASASPGDGTDDSVVGSAGGGVGAPTRALQVYAQLATEDQGATCSSANGAVGQITLIDLSTGKGASVAGAAAAGSVSLNGNAGTAGVALGDAATWSASDGTYSLSAGAALVGQIVLPVTGTAPTTGAEATALFNTAFGANASYGISLDAEAKGPLGKVIGFYGTGTTTVTGPNGGTGTAAVVVGVISYQGNLVAVQTLGMGAMASYAQ